METSMRIFGAAILAASLLVTNAFAETLPVGKPAGVKKAQMEGNALLIIAGVGIVGLGIGLAASSNGGGAVTSTTSSVGTVTP
jgi:uncharacterized membrane protein YedE/YeeE